MIDGIVLGEDPNQGFVENNTFYHPVLKILFPIPTEWVVQNTPQQVQMVPKTGDALMVLTLAPGTSLDESAKIILEQFKLELVESSKETINGLNAMLMIADQKQEQGTIRVLSSLIQFEGNTYSIMGITELAKFQGFQPVFLSTIRNFKELKEADKLNRKPDVVRIKTLPQQMTLQAALQSFKMPEERFEELAILNGMLLSDQLDKGTMIKVIGK